MSQQVNIKYKNNLKKITIRQNLPSEDLQYLLGSHFEIKGKIIGIKDKAGSLYDINSFLVKQQFKPQEIYEIIVDEQQTQKNPLILEHVNISPSKINGESQQPTQYNKEPSSISQFYSTKAALICDLNQFEKIFLQQHDSLLSCLIIFEQFNLKEQQTKFQQIIENYKDEITFYYTISSLLNSNQAISKSNIQIPCLFLYKGQCKILETSINQPSDSLLKIFEKFAKQNQTQSETQEQQAVFQPQLEKILNNIRPSSQPFHPTIQNKPELTKNAFSQQQQQQFVAENESFKGDGNDTEQQDIEQVGKQFISYLDNMLEQQDITNSDYYYIKCQIFEDIEEFISKYFGEITAFDYILFREHILKNISSQQNLIQSNPIKETHQIQDDNLDRPLSRVQLKRTDRKLNQSLNGQQDSFVRLINNLKNNKSITEVVATKSINLIQQDNQGIITSLNKYLQGHILENQLVKELEEHIQNYNIESSKAGQQQQIANELTKLVCQQLTDRIQEDEQIRILNKLASDKDELLLQLIDSTIKLMKVYAKRESNIENINSYQLYLDRQKQYQPFNQVNDDDELNQNQQINVIENNAVTKIDNMIIPSFKQEDNSTNDKLQSNDYNLKLVQSQTQKQQQQQQLGSDKASDRQSTKEKEKSNKSYQEISSKDNNEKEFIDFIDKNIHLLSAEQYGIVMHLYRIKDEDLFQLISQKKDKSPNITSIQVTASKKLNDLMQQEFTNEDINLINNYKNNYNTSTFAIHQRFRIECNFQQFIEELKQALENDKKNPLLNENQIDLESQESMSKDDQDPKQQTPSLHNLNLNYEIGNLKLNKLEQLEPQQQQQKQQQQQNKLIELKQDQENSDKKLHLAKSESDEKGSVDQKYDVKEVSSEQRKIRSGENSPDSVKKKKNLFVETKCKYKKGKQAGEDIRAKSNSDQYTKQFFLSQQSQLNNQKDSVKERSSQQKISLIASKLTIKEDELHQIFSENIQNFFKNDYQLKETQILQEILTKIKLSSEEVSNLYHLLDAHHGDIHEIIYRYKQQQSIQEIEEDLKQIAQIKIQDLGIKKVKKFNHFNAILRQMFENDMTITRRQYNIFIYQFLEEEISTLSVFEAYLLNDDRSEFIENLSLIEKINYFKYNINYQQLEKLNDNHLEKMKFIFSFKESFNDTEQKEIEKMIYSNNSILDQSFKQNKSKQSSQIVQDLKRAINNQIKESRIQLLKGLKFDETLHAKLLVEQLDKNNTQLESILQFYETNQNIDELKENLQIFYKKVFQQKLNLEIILLAQKNNFSEENIKKLKQLIDKNDNILTASYNVYLTSSDNDIQTQEQELLDTIQTYLAKNQ